MGLCEVGPQYQYNHPPVCENADVKLYCNRGIQTDIPTPINVPDLVLTLNEQKKTFIVDFSVQLASNMMKTYVEIYQMYTSPR